MFSRLSKPLLAAATASAGVVAGVSPQASGVAECAGGLQRRSTVGSLGAFRKKLDRIESDLGVGRPNRGAGPQFVLYSNLICPFAQRAHIAALEKGVAFEYAKIPLSVEIARDSSLSKPADFLERVNPAGTVPAIEYMGQPVNESDVCVAFLEDAFPEEGASLRPADALGRAHMALAIKLFDAAPFYRLLKNQDPALDAEKAAQLASMVSKWLDAHDASGPFVCGAQFTAADVIAFPFVDRFRHTLLHYRGFDLLACDERLGAWFAACAGRESAKATSQSGDFYTNWYTGYAGDRGVSTMCK
jgi:glutathione S-transferase